AVLFLLFIIRVNLAKNPVLNLNLLKNHKFLGFILVPVVASFTFVTLLTYFPTYLTGPMQLSASKAGLMMLFLTSPVLVFPLIAGNLASKGVSSKLLMYISIFSMLIGTSLLLSSIDIVLNFSILALSLFLIGIGMGMSAGLVDGEALSCVDPNEIGMAAGLLNTFRLGSEAVAVAVYGSLLSSTLSEIVPENLNMFGLQNISEWINSITAGNFAAMIEGTSGLDQDLLLKEVIATYNHAFTTTNIVLGAIALLVSFMVIGFLRKETKRAPEEALDT
ncbi:MFS transporter, partial [Photobacterium halotolerans]|uniref:MFS transporter n=1 Tax=Photobacterium halotolerans TaxID=265726 RepID=UPI0013727676